MGSFRRRHVHARDRALLERIRERGRAWFPLPDVSVQKRACWYLRFAALEDHADSGQPIGIFVAAYRAVEDETIEPELAARIWTELRWFSDHLRAIKPDTRRAVFFFKADASEHTRRVWILAELLREHGTIVHVTKVRSPGRIVRQDDHQVAAIP